ncbi:ribonuclease 1-like [Tripterygium wilfordii]|uniref:ribonuclease 1-like n=1 Tax=Tripterygium wilfordii TaxID=458696 RepID=UPI0018F85BE3|nr:ribonuclease 1-like [Tripterygium wilfordii]
MLLYGNNTISYLLLLIVIVFALNVKAERYRPYDYYKVSIRWPKSYCLSEDVVGRGYECEEPILANFTVHGVWPMYSHEIIVRPYRDDPRCTETRPMPPESITYDLLGEMLDDMKKYWPNVVTRTQEYNENFWQYQFENHGMCFENPDKPKHYFRSGLKVLKQYDFLEILRRSKKPYPHKQVRPRDLRFNAVQYKQIVKGGLGGVEPQILCNTDSNGTLQFGEIRVCFDKYNEMMDCPYSFQGCGDWRNAKLNFPRP